MSRIARAVLERRQACAQVPPQGGRARNRHRRCWPWWPDHRLGLSPASTRSRCDDFLAAVTRTQRILIRVLVLTVLFCGFQDAAEACCAVAVSTLAPRPSPELLHTHQHRLSTSHVSFFPQPDLDSRLFSSRFRLRLCCLDSRLFLLCHVCHDVVQPTYRYINTKQGCRRAFPLKPVSFSFPYRLVSVHLAYVSITVLAAGELRTHLSPRLALAQLEFSPSPLQPARIRIGYVTFCLSPFLHYLWRHTVQSTSVYCFGILPRVL